MNARKLKSKLRLMMMGPSGSGKTWTTLDLATRLAEKENSRVAFIDTEGNSASLYAAHFDFDVLTLRDNYNPEEYIRGMQAAVHNGYKVLVIDSFSHAWNGANGVLEVVDQAGQKMGGNDWAGWSKGRPLQNRLVNAVLNIPIHIIGTARSKTEWAQEPGRNGKLQPVKVGVGAVQSSEFEYEFTIAALMDMEHNFTITKSKCDATPYGATFSDPADFIEKVYDWLNTGIESDENEREFQKLGSPTPTPAPAPAPRPSNPGKPKTASETWLNNTPAKTRLQHLLAELGYTEADQPKWLSKLKVSRFGEFVGTESELHKRLTAIAKEIAAEMEPAKPKSQPAPNPAPEPAPSTVENPVVVNRVKYIEQGKQKYLAFSTGDKVIRFYGRSTTFKTLVGDEYYAVNKFDEMEANSKGPYGIQPLQITWEDKGTYLNAKDAVPVPEEPLGDVDIDDWFKNEPAEPPTEEGDIPPLPEDSKDIPF